MSDRIKGFTVALSHDMRDDDCQEIINAIKMIRGVEDVTANIVDSQDYIAKKQVKAELREKFWALLDAL